MVTSASHEATNEQSKDGCWVVTQNTFIHVVDTLASAKDTYSLLRKVRSDSDLYRRGGMEDMASQSKLLRDTFDDLSEADASSATHKLTEGTTFPDDLVESEDTQEALGSESDASSDMSARKEDAEELAEGDASVIGAVHAPFSMPLAVLGLSSPEQAMLACIESCASMWLPFGYSCASMLPQVDQQSSSEEAHSYSSGYYSAASRSDDGRTMVMLRNLPNNYTRAMLFHLLESQGFGGFVNFVYLPIDFQTNSALGYAFVNLVSPQVVPHFWSGFDGFTNWAIPSRKVCFVTWCEPNQGLEAHIERYRSSPVMHSSVPDEYKPVLLQNGFRVPFPKPAKTIRAPRVRHGH